MGNCLKGCLSDDTNGGMSRTRMSASDSQYEILIEGMQCTDGHQEGGDGVGDGGELQEAIKIKSNRKSNFFNKFWTKTNVDYARLNKVKHNNFSKRAVTAGGNTSKHNQHPKPG
uniref:Uncharacterized protein n=1 Tax=Anopheles maculatus TaxID=74869 RepID=A0A182T501_9DIPT